jgi:glycosyltransferase involved in cell wall biosynthesis
MSDGTRSVVVDASNLHVGGGVQVAASILDEMSRLDGPGWIPRASYLVSSEVDANVSPATRERLHLQVADTRPLTPRRWVPRRRRYDVSFSVFGPEYGWPRARRRVVGFADVRSIYPTPVGMAATRRERAFVSLRSLVARRMFKSADRLVVESQAMADRLVEVGLAGRTAVEVVSNSYSAVFDEPEQWVKMTVPRSGAPREFVLCFIARAYPHKNHAFLPRLAAAASELGVKLTFLVTLTDEEWGTMPADVRACCVNVGAISVAQAPEIYESVDGSVFPSLLEAFSATPVEAMKMGRVLFASDRDFVRAVCGDAAVYFDPLDAREAASSIVEVLTDPTLQARYVARGHRVVAQLPTATERAREMVRIIDEELELART